MERLIYYYIYSIPLRYIVSYMLVLILIWRSFEIYAQIRPAKRKIWKQLNILVAIGSISVIGIATLYLRSSGNVEVVLIPFKSFQEAKLQPEHYRSMLMNVFLFFPLGLSLPFSLPKNWKGKVLCTIMFAMLLSICIEFFQYRYALGTAEIDDVICNTFGCVVGSTAYVLVNRTKRK